MAKHCWRFCADCLPVWKCIYNSLPMLLLWNSIGVMCQLVQQDKSLHFHTRLDKAFHLSFFHCIWVVRIPINSLWFLRFQLLKDSEERMFSHFYRSRLAFFNISMWKFVFSVSMSVVCCSSQEVLQFKMKPSNNFCQLSVSHLFIDNFLLNQVNFWMFQLWLAQICKVVFKMSREPIQVSFRSLWGIGHA